jgi:hypothetical protein
VAGLNVAFSLASLKKIQPSETALAQGLHALSASQIQLITKI